MSLCQKMNGAERAGYLVVVVVGLDPGKRAKTKNMFNSN